MGGVFSGPPIVVFDATGTEGNAVVRCLLQHRTRVRAVVPDATSFSAQHLEKLGAEVFEHTNDVKGLAEILEGAHGAYCTLNPFSCSARGTQLAAKRFAAAAKAANLEHVIWSTFEDTCAIIPDDSETLPLDKSRCRVPLFDGRGRSDHYFNEAEVPTTFLIPSFFYESFLDFEALGFLPRRAPNGQLFVELPISRDQPVPLVSAEDVAECARQIFRKGKDMLRKYVPVCGDLLTGSQIAGVFSKHLGEEVAFRYLPPAEFRKMHASKSEALGLMFQYFKDCNEEACKIRSISRTQELVAAARPLHAWFSSGRDHVQALQRNLKIITVFGATGAQGGALVRAILQDPGRAFAVRAVTRDALSKASLALADLGAEVVQCNIDDKEQVKEAMKGAYGAFCITFFWDHFSPEKECAHAKIYAEAAAETQVCHVIWSTAEDTNGIVPPHDYRIPRIQKKSVVPLFDGKGRGDAFFQSLQIPTTFLTPAFYFENLITFAMGPKLCSGGPGDATFMLPMKTRALPLIAAADIGLVAYHIFQNSELVGHHVPACGELLTGPEIADHLSSSLGTEVRFKCVDQDEFSSSGVLAADYWFNAFQYCRYYNDSCMHRRNPAKSRELHPQMQGLTMWLRQNKAGLTPFSAAPVSADQGGS
ncbi:NMRAL1 [Symbiodinium necroappetens]|uniref:NMRAL1 protein n=1 Tax=Symbiodinium necroappetens TaxID=1628268 RepID=A0A812X7G3_9DINO|nr:NMRAL1 [Symbiodinium necroappetens]